MIRLGIISDTHYPNRIPTLPFDAIEDAFRNVDAILHAGDIETDEVLNHLSEIAPVQAVKGDDDLLDIPLKRVIEIGGIRIGLAHGHYQNPLLEEFYRIRRRLGYSQHRELTERIDKLLAKFRDDKIDVLIFGHSHRPMCIEREGILLFNPGAVYAMTLESAQWQLPREKNPLRRQMLRQYIQRNQFMPSGDETRSTVGILEIDANRYVQPSIQELPLVDYAHYMNPLSMIPSWH